MKPCIHITAFDGTFSNEKLMEQDSFYKKLKMLLKYCGRPNSRIRPNLESDLDNLCALDPENLDNLKLEKLFCSHNDLIIVIFLTTFLIYLVE